MESEKQIIYDPGLDKEDYVYIVTKIWLVIVDFW